MRVRTSARCGLTAATAVLAALMPAHGAGAAVPEPNPAVPASGSSRPRSPTRR